MPSTAYLQVARAFSAPVQTVAVSKPASVAQQCSPLEQRAEQWMVEEAVRIPVSRAELRAPQRASRERKKTQNRGRGFRRGGALWWGIIPPIDTVTKIYW